LPTRRALSFEGNPIVIAQDGKLIRENLRRERMTEDEVSAEMPADRVDRPSAVGDPSNGSISFIEK
jgi:uncharacterized membrane protein YcaP (DUF421 family)